MPVITIEPTGDTVEIAPGQTLLDACLRNGIWLPHACGHGLCGTCKVTVLEGDVEHGNASSFALMDFERDEGKTLACSAMALGDVTIEADIDDDADARRISVGDYEGTVGKIEKLTPAIRGIWLDLPGPGIDFQPGQYINLSIPNVEGTRAFSIASTPTEPNRIELHVRRVPGGKATPLLHDTLKKGDKLRLTGPFGRFYVRKSAARPLIFLAAGSGLSSPKSMILDLLASGYEQPITLIHGGRRPHDLHFSTLFRELESKHPNLRYIPVVSRAETEDAWGGERGYVQDVAQRLFNGQFAGYQAYLCGQPSMIDSAITTLMRGRLFERDIYMEKFLTATDAVPQARSPLFKRI